MRWPAGWRGCACRDDRQCVAPAASVEAIGSGAALTADRQPRASWLVNARCGDRADVILGCCSRWRPARPGHGAMHSHRSTRQRDRADAAHLLAHTQWWRRRAPRRRVQQVLPAAIGDAQRRSMDGPHAISSCRSRTSRMQFCTSAFTISRAAGPASRWSHNCHRRDTTVTQGTRRRSPAVSPNRHQI